jgi:hypothetical protein
LVVFCSIWVFGVAVLLRLDRAVVDFVGHAKDLSLIHGAVADSPTSFVTQEGSTIDAASLQDLHDKDTALLHGARNHMLFVLGCVVLVPITIAGLLVGTPRVRPTARKSRSK